MAAAPASFKRTVKIVTRLVDLREKLDGKSSAGKGSLIFSIAKSRYSFRKRFIYKFEVFALYESGYFTLLLDRFESVSNDCDLPILFVILTTL